MRYIRVLQKSNRTRYRGRFSVNVHVTVTVADVVSRKRAPSRLLHDTSGTVTGTFTGSYIGNGNGYVYGEATSVTDTGNRSSKYR